MAEDCPTPTRIRGALLRGSRIEASGFGIGVQDLHVEGRRREDMIFEMNQSRVCRFRTDEGAIKLDRS